VIVVCTLAVTHEVSCVANHSVRLLLLADHLILIFDGIYANLS